MRRALLLGTAVASALLAVAWARGGGRTPTSPSPVRTAVAPPSRFPRESDGRGPAPETGRNLFEFGRQEPSARLSQIIEPHEDRRTAPESTTTPDAVRFVGVVHRGEDVRAALSILGEVVILAPGEAASGYTLLAVDEDMGARLRGPSGTEVTVSATP